MYSSNMQLIFHTYMHLEFVGFPVEEGFIRFKTRRIHYSTWDEGVWKILSNC